jgi:NAD(P)-dependent dehydrogenase (short-subunit alcohol dehydrogenase family)
VAFITGAGSGIARASAHAFAREGAKVVIAELSTELGSAAETDVRNAGGEATFVRTDVTDEASVEQAIKETVAHYGALHVLFNCAGGSIGSDGPVTDVDMSVWDHTINLDLKGTFLCCRYGIPRIIEAGGGSVVNTSSVVALQGQAMHVYTAAKGGVLSLTRALAAQYARQQIRVNAICPGLVMTERVSKRLGPLLVKSGPAPAGGLSIEDHPFSIGEPEDIAAVALFLASDESRMVNAAVIAADGGMSAY